MASAPTGTPRLVQALHFDRAEGGSFALMIAGVLRAATARGWRAEVVTLPAPHDRPWLEELAATGAGVHVAPPELLHSRRRQARWLVDELGRGGPTAIHTHFTSWDVGARIAAPRLGEPSAVFWHVHSALSDRPSVVARTAFKFALLGRSVDGFLCPAPNLVEGVRRRGARRDRVFFIPSALDTDRFPLLGDERRRAARADLGLPDDAWMLLHFGWHPHLKGTDRFLSVLAELSEHAGRPVHGIVRGGGEETADLAAQLGVAERVHAQGPIDDISTLFAAADALVAGSREEGMAYSVLESLCSGTPVVATDIPGHAVIGEQVAACRIVPHSPAALAAGVRETLDRSVEQAAAEAAAGREWVVDNLGIDVVSSHLLAMYSGALRLDPDQPRLNPEWLSPPAPHPQREPASPRSGATRP